MFESSKTRAIRGAGFDEKYFSQTVLDIGCGPDKVVPHAQPFDQEHGDANDILKYIPAQSFDTVHSSHCLEHMKDPVSALSQWWEVVKPGGYLITVVPEEDLYEQGQWPSRFNFDHKATFTLKRPTTWSPVSYDLYEIHKALPNSQIVGADMQDDCYKHELMRLGVETQTSLHMRVHLHQLLQNLFDKNLRPTLGLIDELNETFVKMGCVVDQTTGNAAAQIQVIAQKVG